MFSKNRTVTHIVLRCKCRVIRFVKTRGVWTVEILDGPRAGQWYDAREANLKPA